MVSGFWGREAPSHNGRFAADRLQLASLLLRSLGVFVVACAAGVQQTFQPLSVVEHY